MKKYTSFSLVLVLALILSGFSNAKTANAIAGAYSDIAGCNLKGQAFSVTTGQPCDSIGTVTGCQTGYLFSPVTGQPCPTPLPTVKYFPVFTIGSTGNEVKTIQSILKDQGYYLGKIDGNYGKRTARAVKDFQDDNDLPITGNVDADTFEQLSRLGIKYPIDLVVSCDPLPIGVSAKVVDGKCVFYPSKNDSIKVINPNGGGYFAKGTTQNINWSDNSGASCQVGIPCTSPTYNYDITLTSVGGDYIQTRTIASPVKGSSYPWKIPNCTASNPCSSNFEIPEGAYTIQVCRTGTSICDSSDSYFKIIGSTTSNQYPVVSGVNGPQSLNVSQLGTWGVNASDPNHGNLYYSVVWGDENENYISSQSSTQLSKPISQQSATFTHSYSYARNYTPTFTVTNSSGQTTQTSLSVNVGNVTTSTSSITVLSPNGGETLAQGSTFDTGDFLNYKSTFSSKRMGNLCNYITESNNIKDWRNKKNYYVGCGLGYNPAISNTDSGGIQINNSFYPGNYYFLSTWQSQDGVEDVYDFSDAPFTISGTSAGGQPTISVFQNSAFGTPTYPNGQNAPVNARIGSYSLTAPSSEGATVQNVTVTLGSNGSEFRNLRVKVAGGMQFGSYQPTLSAGASYSFSTAGSVIISAGQTVYVDVEADVLVSTTPGIKPTITALTACAVGSSSGKTNCSGASGQDVIVSGTTSTSSVQVTSPNGNEVLGLNDTNMMTWSASSDIQRIDLALYKNDPSLGFVYVNMIGTNVPNTGHYAWIPSSVVSSVTASSGARMFKIFIMGTKSGGATVEDYSNDYFSIINR